MDRYSMTEEKPKEAETPKAPETPKEAEPTPASDEDETGGYTAKYIRVSKVKELFKDKDQQIRISGEVKADVWKFLDDYVTKGVQELISRLPRKSKGDHKGELVRITISKEELQPK